jgi:hypothetical protein
LKFLGYNSFAKIEDALKNGKIKPSVIRYGLTHCSTEAMFSWCGAIKEGYQGSNLAELAERVQKKEINQLKATLDDLKRLYKGDEKRLCEILYRDHKHK